MASKKKQRRKSSGATYELEVSGFGTKAYKSLSSASAAAKKAKRAGMSCRLFVVLGGKRARIAYK